MAKYIDAEGVMRACYDSFVKTNNKAYKEIALLVEAVPAADVVEVVRCRDCEYWSKSFEINRHRRCINTSICTSADFYCKWGSKE